MTVETTTTLSDQLSTFYEKVFLDRAQYEFVYNKGGQMRTNPDNEGKAVKFNRLSPLSISTATLTEGTNPSEVSLTTATVTATLGEYGQTVRKSKFASLTLIDANDKEVVEVVGQNMGETLDQLTRDELFTGATSQIVAGKALSLVAASDVLTVAEIRKAVRTLEANKARRYSGYYYMKTSPYPQYDLQGDSNWVNASIYRDSDDRVKTGALGEIFGVRLWVSKNPKVEASGASSANAYSNFIHGDSSFGCYDLSKDTPKLYIVPHTQVDSGNSTGRFSLISWAGAYVCKTLNANWLVNIKTGATQ